MPEISQDVGVHILGKFRKVAVAVGISTVGGKAGGGKGFKGESGFTKIESTSMRRMNPMTRMPNVRILRNDLREEPGVDEKEDFTVSGPLALSCSHQSFKG